MRSMFHFQLFYWKFGGMSNFRSIVANFKKPLLSSFLHIWNSSIFLLLEFFFSTILSHHISCINNVLYMNVAFQWDLVCCFMNFIHFMKISQNLLERMNFTSTEYPHIKGKRSCKHSHSTSKYVCKQKTKGSTTGILSNHKCSKIWSLWFTNVNKIWQYKYIHTRAGCFFILFFSGCYPVCTVCWCVSLLYLKNNSRITNNISTNMSRVSERASIICIHTKRE